MRILVIDDDNIIRQKMLRMLGVVGECTCAPDGPSGVEAFRRAIDEQRPFDLITLDVNMPGMDGTETLYEIRRIEKDLELERPAQAKVMMITGAKDKDTVITCVQAGCNAYLVKPFNINTFVNKLKDMGLAVYDQRPGTC